MDKFPLLLTLRIILWISFAIALGLAAFQYSQELSDPWGNSTYALVGILPVLGFALGVAVVAELIGLFVRMEGHLEAMKEDQKYTNQQLLKSALARKEASQGDPAKPNPTEGEARQPE